MAPSEFSMSAQRDHSTSVLVLAGEIDLAVAAVVRDQLAALTADEPAGLIIDLSDVSFMDSSGLNVLVSTFKEVKRYDGRLAIVADAPNLRRLFELTQLSSLFNVVTTRAEADEVVKAPTPS